MKKAILVVSFGTTHLDTLVQSIEATEQYIAAAFPRHEIYRAFSSSTVLARLKANHNLCVDSVTEALKRIEADGFTQVTVQPTLLIPGKEYDKVCAMVRNSSGTLSVRMGHPLLYSPQDTDRLIGLIEMIYPVPSDTVLLMMGHGTEHDANSFYIQLAEKMRKRAGSHMRLCTVEGVPSFEDGVREVTGLPVRKAVAAPLMLVSGDHARNDMDGSEPHSLRSLLEQAGFTVECQIRGLGQFPQIQDLYIERIQNASPL